MVALPRAPAVFSTSTTQVLLFLPGLATLPDPVGSLLPVRGFLVPFVVGTADASGGGGGGGSCM